jgi:hypothetical protein
MTGQRSNLRYCSIRDVLELVVEPPNRIADISLNGDYFDA